jgi:ABC-type Mn2+/Zn2+ transport system permease subunit
MADDPGVFTDDSAIPMADDPAVFTDDSAIPMADDPGVFSGEDGKDGASVAAAADHHGGEKPAVEAAGNVSGEALGSVGGSDWVAGHEPCDNTWSLPWLMALLFACAGALILGFVREGRQVTRGWLLGAVFVAASGAVLLLGGFIQQEMHDVNDVLFGNAIAISTDQMWQAIMVAALVLALHVWLAPLFLSYAFDPVTARAHGFPVQLLDAVLFLSMGLAIASGTRVVGALPEFAFAVFPGMAALSLVRKARWLMVVAALFGAASAFVGYWASFVLSLPTGATMAAAALALTLLARVAGRVLHRS